MQLAGKDESFLIVPVFNQDTPTFKLMSYGREISLLKENGQAGWEVSGQPLNADELDIITEAIKKNS